MEVGTENLDRIRRLVQMYDLPDGDRVELEASIYSGPLKPASLKDFSKIASFVMRECPDAEIQRTLTAVCVEDGCKYRVCAPICRGGRVGGVRIGESGEALEVLLASELSVKEEKKLLGDVRMQEHDIRVKASLETRVPEGGLEAFCEVARALVPVYRLRERVSMPVKSLGYRVDVTSVCRGGNASDVVAGTAEMKYEIEVEHIGERCSGAERELMDGVSFVLGVLAGEAPLKVAHPDG